MDPDRAGEKPSERFQRLVRAPEAELRLDEAALCVAACARPSVDVDAWCCRLDDLAGAATMPTFAAVRRAVVRARRLSRRHRRLRRPAQLVPRLRGRAAAGHPDHAVGARDRSRAPARDRGVRHRDARSLPRARCFRRRHVVRSVPRRRGARPRRLRASVRDGARRHPAAAPDRPRADSTACDPRPHACQPRAGALRHRSRAARHVERVAPRAPGRPDRTAGAARARSRPRWLARAGRTRGTSRSWRARPTTSPSRCAPSRADSAPGGTDR